MAYSCILDREVLNKAVELARGSYQIDLLYGNEAMSGATLRGKARRYGGRYAESRRNLMARIRAAGLPITEVRERYGKRVLVIGAA